MAFKIFLFIYFLFPKEDPRVAILLRTLLVYACSVFPLTALWGSWLGHDRGSVQSATEALSAAEEQPLAFHKEEKAALWDRQFSV